MLAVALLLLFAVAMHWPVFFDGKTVSAFDAVYAATSYRELAPAGFTRAANPLLMDSVVQFQPWDIAMYQGPLEFPWLWNPYAGCGSPMLANGQSAPFYPLKLIYAIAGVRRGFGFVCAAKMALAALLMWLYLRTIGVSRFAALAGALSFMGCGFMTAWMLWPHTNVAVMLPTLFLGWEWLCRGRRLAGFATVAAAVVVGALGGHPETLLHVVVALALCAMVLWVLTMRRGPSGARREGNPAYTAPHGALLAAAVLCGLLMAAVQLLPLAEYVANSAALADRRAHASPGLGPSVLGLVHTARALNEMVTWILPNAHGNPAVADPWRNPFSNFNESAGYVGIGMFIMAVLSWRYVRERPHIGALGAVQILSIGFVLAAPVVVATVGQLPLMNVAANKRFLLLFCFANAAMGSLALDEWMARRRRAWPDVLVIGLLTAIGAALVLRVYLPGFGGVSAAWESGGRGETIRLAAFAAASVTALCLLRKAALFQGLGCGIWIACLAVDLATVHFAYNPFADPRDLYPETRSLRFLTTVQLARVLPVSVHFPPNCLSLYGIAEPRLYDALTYRPYDSLLARIRDRDSEFGKQWGVTSDAPTPLTALASVRYLWRWPRPLSAEEAGRLAYADSWNQIVEDTNAWPRAYVATAWLPASSPRNAIDQWLNLGTAGRTVFVEGLEAGALPHRSPGADAALRPARIAEDRPHRVVIELPPDPAGLFVLHDTYYPGWKARVDGHERRIYRVNGAFRGVALAPEDRTVVFSFEPLSFRFGALVSCFSAIVFAFALTAAAVSSQRRPPSENV